MKIIPLMFDNRTTLMLFLAGLNLSSLIFNFGLVVQIEHTMLPLQSLHRVMFSQLNNLFSILQLGCYLIQTHKIYHQTMTHSVVDHSAPFSMEQIRCCRPLRID